MNRLLTLLAGLWPRTPERDYWQSIAYRKGQEAYYSGRTENPYAHPGPGQERLADAWDDGYFGRR